MMRIPSQNSYLRIRVSEFHFVSLFQFTKSNPTTISELFQLSNVYLSSKVSLITMMLTSVQENDFIYLFIYYLVISIIKHSICIHIHSQLPKYKQNRIRKQIYKKQINPFAYAQTPIKRNRTRRHDGRPQRWFPVQPPPSPLFVSYDKRDYM